MEDDIYYPAEKLAKNREDFKGLGEQYEKSFYREDTYGEKREREGRREEKLLRDSEWEGRNRDRRWRGRSSSRGRERRSDYAEVWRGSIGVTSTQQEEDPWRGRLSGEWSGRVSSVEREVENRDSYREWRGRSPGVSDISVTFETWV